MEQQCIVSVWGVRGSAPVPDSAYLNYGGNTSCVSAAVSGQYFVFDAGSGLAQFGKSLPVGEKHISLFITHLHLDHIMGFPLFPALFDPDVTLDVYGPAGVKQALETIVSPPLWPIGLAGFSAKLTFTELTPGDSVEIDGCTVHTLAGEHRGGSTYYRLCTPGGDLVYALDCELTEQLAPALTDFCRGAKALVWDSHFAPEDLRPGWGHSTWKQGAALGRAAGVARVLMAHHNHDDAFLDGQAAQAGAETGVEVIFAREGMRLCL